MLKWELLCNGCPGNFFVLVGTKFNKEVRFMKCLGEFCASFASGGPVQADSNPLFLSSMCLSHLEALMSPVTSYVKIQTA